LELNPPKEFASYLYDHESSKTPLLSRILGWFSLIVLTIGIYATFYLSGQQMILMSSMSYGGAAVLFCAYVIVKIVKRSPRCSQCGKNMDVVAVRWTPEQFRKIMGYEDGFSGADGNFYTSERSKNTGSSPHCSIWVQLQVWCVCHQCHVYFLKAKHSREQLMSTRSDDEFEQAKHALLTDPNARKQIESAYKAVRYNKITKKD